jgi:hypothetical protein
MESLNPSGRVILSGASGMLGRALQHTLAEKEIPTLQLLRRVPASEGQLQWHPNSDHAIENPAPLEGSAAAIHLSGASVAGHRWTDEYRREITASRVDTTRRLAMALAGLNRPPQTFVVASAVGIYGDRGDEVLTESSNPGSGFLAEVCQRWEAAAEPAERAGIRVVHMRFGVVLGPNEGALKQMLPPFRVGLGARLGNGRQWMSWIGLADAVAAILFSVDAAELSGPVNATSPNPVTNAEFTKALGKQLRKPAILAMPTFALRVIFGAMADEALLASERAVPAKLQAAGFQFSLPDIESALRVAVG